MFRACCFGKDPLPRAFRAALKRGLSAARLNSVCLDTWASRLAAATLAPCSKWAAAASSWSRVTGRLGPLTRCRLTRRAFAVLIHARTATTTASNSGSACRQLCGMEGWIPMAWAAAFWSPPSRVSAASQSQLRAMTWTAWGIPSSAARSSPSALAACDSDCGLTPAASAASPGVPPSRRSALRARLRWSSLRPRRAASARLWAARHAGHRPPALQPDGVPQLVRGALHEVIVATPLSLLQRTLGRSRFPCGARATARPGTSWATRAATARRQPAGNSTASARARHPLE